jgi:hypothetical protein
MQTESEMDKKGGWGAHHQENFVHALCVHERGKERVSTGIASACSSRTWKNICVTLLQKTGSTQKNVHKHSIQKILHVA